MTQQTIEEPSKGGSYVRNEDGTLTLVQRTEPAKPRDKREAADAADAAAAPDTSAPAKASDAKQE